MAALLLSLSGIALTFGGAPLFTRVDLALAPGARIALAGRNGSGKSTLMKVAAGLVEADAGERFVNPGATVRYLEQEPGAEGFSTVGAYAAASLGPADDPSLAAALLEELGLEELVVLFRECRVNDEQGAQILETYLDRMHGDSWREQSGGGGDRSS